VLTVQNVGRTFQSRQGPVVALDDINLSIAEGQFVSVVGASGSGKSTLLRLVDGLISPTSGRVLVRGRQVTAPGRDRAMVFQQDNLLPWLSVIDNIGYGLRLAGVQRSEARRRAAEYVALVGLSGFESSYPHQLSGGMRQRANVARALAVDPDVLLMDEPFAALDAQTREIMQSELLRIWQEHRKTVLFVTHQIDEAVYLSDTIVVLSAHPGRVRAVIDVDLPRPRTLHTKRTAAFGEIVDRVWGLIEFEVRNSMGLPTAEQHAE
jgi:NitT/TauT family transport system ATP-binding protein